MCIRLCVGAVDTLCTNGGVDTKIHPQLIFV